jgi:hypothetical protein
MKSKKTSNSKNTKFVRIDNSTWIEADILVPDEVARIQFLQKMQLTKPSTFMDQLKNNKIIVNN